VETLYLCGAGNPEGVRLALTLNTVHKRWARIVLLDDDPSRHGQQILGVEIAGPFSALEHADPSTAEVSNMVARTAGGRQSAFCKIQPYGLPFANLIDPSVDLLGVDLGCGITVYRNTIFCANATVGDGAVIFAGAVVGHGCRLARGCIVAPGAVINARVELGDGVYVGTNASIMPDLKVGSGSVVGANSAVIQDVPAGVTVMGVPARIIMQSTDASAPGEIQPPDHRPFEWPSTEMEKKLAALWMKILGVHRVGRHDNFFSMGGTSINAASLFVEIEQRFFRRLPLSTLLQAPTLKQLAGLIQEGGKTNWSPLVTIRAGGDQSPLFLVHGAEGNVLLYRDLARYLGEDRPLYGLQSQGLDGSGRFLTRLEEMASTYLREIRQVQSEGPYFLGGYCLGGIIALEMAQQLRAQGEQVAMVGMIEAYNVQVLPKTRSRLLSLFHLAQNLWYHLRSVLALGMSDRAKFLKNKWTVAKGRLGIRFASWINSKKREDDGGRQAYPHLAIAKANEEAAFKYVPKTYIGKVVVFRPKGHFLGQNDPAFGWGGVVREGLTVRQLPVYPKAMLVEPFVKDLAEEFKSCIEQSCL
jgi:sugar O-acyltransferase (sialic acid O-acetyltransferase NeuD family)